MLLLGLAGCDRPRYDVQPQRIEDAGGKFTNGQSVGLSLLFEHDGCRMWRFVDDNRYRYFANCSASSSVSSAWSENCGKGCVRQVEDDTGTTYKPASAEAPTP